MKELELQMATDISERILNQYGELQESFMEQGGYEMESKLISIANGLAITSFLQQKFDALSGGEKTKVMLGQILLKNPDILLLDEPTNHLDLTAIQWLEQHIQQFQGTVVLVSHDRQFMNHVVNKVIELEDGQCWESHGNYDAFLLNREAKLEQQFSEYKEQQRKSKRLKKRYVDCVNGPMKLLHRILICSVRQRPWRKCSRESKLSKSLKQRKR